MAPKIFGIEHLLYLLVALSIMAGLIFLVKKKLKSEEQKTLLIKILAILLFASIAYNRISIALVRSNFTSLIPSSFCGISSLTLSIIVLSLKKDNALLHSVAYTGLLGSIITLIYPDFIGQNESFFYSMTISGLLHHTVTFYLVIVMLLTGYLKPSLKKWHYLPLGLAFYMLFGLFLIKNLGYSDAMYINKPILPGTPLYWDVLGSIFLALHFFFLLAWEYLKKKQIRV